MLAARRVDRLEELAARLPNAIATACDVAAPGDIAALVDTTVGRALLATLAQLTGSFDSSVGSAHIERPSRTWLGK